MRCEAQTMPWPAAMRLCIQYTLVYRGMHIPHMPMRDNIPYRGEHVISTGKALITLCMSIVYTTAQCPPPPVRGAAVPRSSQRFRHDDASTPSPPVKILLRLYQRIPRPQPHARLVQRKPHRPLSIPLLLRVLVGRVQEAFTYEGEIRLHLFDALERNVGQELLDPVQVGRLDADGKLGPVEKVGVRVVRALGDEDGNTTREYRVVCPRRPAFSSAFPPCHG